MLHTAHLKIQDKVHHLRSAHHCTTLSGYIFATKAYIESTIGKTR